MRAQTSAGSRQLPFGKKIIYALGQFGWSLASYGVLNLINYFYMPPEEKSGTIFPAFLFQGAILGIVTIVGLVNAGGRLFDAVSDPVIAGLSDRSKAPMGKRRLFMSIGVLPFSLFSVLVFMPPAAGRSPANVVWFIVSIVLFYLAMTIYVIPYTALISELGHNSNERLTLSTLISITWALGFAVGNQVYALQSAFESSMGAVPAFQLSVGIFAVVGFIFMMLPVLFIDERKYAEDHVSKEGSFQGFISAFKNRDFLFFTLSDFMYWLALTFIQTGISFYVTILMGLDKAFASLLMTVLFLLSFAFYVPVTLIARKIGKKLLLIIAFAVFSLVFIIVFFIGSLPLSGQAQGFLLVALAAFPIATFGILPNAIVADLAESDGISRGSYKAGIFFGGRNLMMKLGVSVANLLFPSFLLLGRSVNNSTGVRLTAVAAFVFCLAGLFLFLAYREKSVAAVLARKEDGAAGEAD
jgi:Na+/melibiose symporter-like transporter